MIEEDRYHDIIHFDALLPLRRRRLSQFLSIRCLGDFIWRENKIAATPPARLAERTDTQIRTVKRTFHAIFDTHNATNACEEPKSIIQRKVLSDK